MTHEDKHSPPQSLKIKRRSIDAGKHLVQSIMTLLAIMVLIITMAPQAVAQQSSEIPSDIESNNANHVAPDRQDLEPAKPGFNDNNVDNDAGADWEPTESPKNTITPGQMRSDREGVPAGFTKEEADRAEVQEAREQAAMRRTGVQAFAAAVPTNCRTYWPSTFRVCGEIRKKYDAMGARTVFSRGRNLMNSGFQMEWDVGMSSSMASSTGTHAMVRIL